MNYLSEAIASKSRLRNNHISMIPGDSWPSFECLVLMNSEKNHDAFIRVQKWHIASVNNSKWWIIWAEQLPAKASRKTTMIPMIPGDFWPSFEWLVFMKLKNNHDAFMRIQEEYIAFVNYSRGWIIRAKQLPAKADQKTTIFLWFLVIPDQVLNVWFSWIQKIITMHLSGFRSDTLHL